ncbi:PspA/IM30 family protein [Sorangium cellulosum]|uniref:Uncharacterized protein n=1 Tax=Sorangium cellulosum TaxID=56 RepID=A0A150QDJ5_SORCE|nr:hypothetical protein [Sorangium cellulosum]KYF66067.1 hypothetical protein BE15_41555 [Sorangium cellulosum]
MESKDGKLAELAGRIERDLKRIDDIAPGIARLEPARARETVPHRLVRAFARLRRRLYSQPSAGEERARGFEEVQRRLESLERYGAALAREAALQAANAVEWERNAKLAVRAGDEVLAREALFRKREALALAATLEQQAAIIATAMVEYTSALAVIKASSR